MGTPRFPPVRACLFDMDGLLLDTEDLYTLTINKVLERYDRPPMPWSLKAQMQGRPSKEATELFLRETQLPLTREEYYARLSELQREHFPSAQPLPGVLALLEALDRSGTYVALATSSHEINYRLKTSHLPQLFERYFTTDVIVRGDDPRIPSGRGKPAPDIFLVALDAINTKRLKKGESAVQPDECLVFEDSVPGVEAGRRAGMRVIWCPHPELLGEFQGRINEVLAGQTAGALPALPSDSRDMQTPSAPLASLQNSGERDSRKGWPGQKGDGWAELVPSLEHFDIDAYTKIKPEHGS